MLKELSWPLQSLFILFSLAYLILVMHLPVNIKINEIYDDALFWDHAQQILAGNWLGNYNNLTLAKGVGFPLFLVINSVLGIPVTLFIALLYLFACVLLAKTLMALKINQYFVLIIFVIILFHPALFLRNIIRDNIYPALSLIIVSGVIRLVFAPEKFDHTLRSVIPYGIALGWFWLTREEGIWIVPGIIILLALRVIQLKKQNVSLKGVFYRSGFLSIIAIALVSLVALVNYHKYGKFEAVDFKGSAYSSALKRLYSVDVGQELPYIPVSFAKRQAIYKISPSFNKLSTFFDVNPNRWKGLGCKIYPWACEDYVGGWFDWALRDAVSSQGFYDSPVHADAFYNAITKEIDTACEQGLIKCKSNYIPFLSNISSKQWQAFPEKIISAFVLAMVQDSDIKKKVGTSSPLLSQLQILSQAQKQEQQQKVRLFLGNPIVASMGAEMNTSLTGWFYSGNANWLSTHCWVEGKEINKVVERQASPDIVEQFKDLNANSQRFFIKVQNNENCSVFVDRFPMDKFAIGSLRPGFMQLDLNGQRGSLYIETILNSALNPVVEKALQIKKILFSSYQIVMPYIVILGLGVYILCGFLIVFGCRPMTDVFMVSTLLWCLFISRVVLLVLVDMSSFPAINSHYLSAAYPILCLAAFLSILLFEKLNLLSVRRLKVHFKTKLGL